VFRHPVAIHQWSAKLSRKQFYGPGQLIYHIHSVFTGSKMSVVKEKREGYDLLYAALDVPVDVGYMVYAIMFYEGVGNLFPWNAFITASNYYGQRFCGTSFEGNFENFFSITYTLSQTIGLALSVVYQNKLSLRSKIVYPLTCWSLVFLFTTVLVTIDDIDPTLLFWLTLISACLCGLLGAVLSGGLFGLGAMFPPAYTAALMNGQGVAGLTVAASGLLTSLATSAVDECSDDNAGDDGDCAQSIDYSALAYFIIATLILASCVFAFLGLNQFTFAK
jgi:equilibrative nucleoside transporter 1/2/3